MVRAVSGILIGTLLLCGIRAGGQSRNSQDERSAVAAVTLTNDRPSGSLPLDLETVAQAPPVLALTVKKVVNPGNVSLGISVYLTYLLPAPASGTSERPRKKSLIGNVSLYPPDHPAGFLLRATGAFREIREAGAISKSSDVRLLLEMKRVHEKQPWSQVELVFAPPEWRQTEPR